jgi:hypothetical protein
MALLAMLMILPLLRAIIPGSTARGSLQRPWASVQPVGTVTQTASRRTSTVRSCQVLPMELMTFERKSASRSNTEPASSR